MAKGNNKTSNVKENKKVNLKAIAILIIIVAIVITTIFIIQNNKHKDGEENNNEEAYLGNPEDNMGLIDMNNLENAQISEGIKQNTSENVAKDRTLEGLKITEIKLSAENGISNFTATVTNNTGTDFAGGIATIVFTNQDGSEYATLEVFVPEVKNGQTNTINAGTTTDIANAYDFTITLQR